MKLKNILNSLKKKINQNLNVIEPFSFLSVLDDPDLHSKVAKIYSNNYVKSYNFPPIKNRNVNKKIKVAYFSPDLNDDHPILKLIPELFELHDKNLFEIYCFSFSEVNFDNRNIKRIKLNCTEFINANELTSIKIIDRARSLSLDIAIDLCGHTNKSLFEFFQVRLAPVQINYLGYSSTMGSVYYDYIIVDKTIVDESLRKFYTEKQIRLPCSYMICDQKNLLINNIEISNLNNEIPKGKFVYCCLSNSYRFNLGILEVWADILNNVPNSILWISENNIFFKNNIINFFYKFNLGNDRIFFAKRKKNLSIKI